MTKKTLLFVFMMVVAVVGVFCIGDVNKAHADNSFEFTPTFITKRINVWPNALWEDRNKNIFVAETSMAVPTNFSGVLELQMDSNSIANIVQGSNWVTSHFYWKIESNGFQEGNTILQPNVSPYNPNSYILGTQDVLRLSFQNGQVWKGENGGIGGTVTWRPYDPTIKISFVMPNMQSVTSPASINPNVYYPKLRVKERNNLQLPNEFGMELKATKPRLFLTFPTILQQPPTGLIPHRTAIAGNTYPYKALYLSGDSNECPDSLGWTWSFANCVINSGVDVTRDVKTKVGFRNQDKQYVDLAGNYSVKAKKETPTNVYAIPAVALEEGFGGFLNSVGDLGSNYSTGDPTLFRERIGVLGSFVASPNSITVSPGDYFDVSLVNDGISVVGAFGVAVDAPNSLINNFSIVNGKYRFSTYDVVVGSGQITFTYQGRSTIVSFTVECDSNDTVPVCWTIDPENTIIQKNGTSTFFIDTRDVRIGSASVYVGAMSTSSQPYVWPVYYTSTGDYYSTLIPNSFSSTVNFGPRNAELRLKPLGNAVVGQQYVVVVQLWSQSGGLRGHVSSQFIVANPVSGAITINGASTISVQSGNTFSTQYTASGPSSVSSVDWDYTPIGLPGVGFGFIPTTTTLGSPTTFRVIAPSGVTSTTTGTVRLNAYNTANHNNPPSTPFDVDVTILPQSATSTTGPNFTLNVLPPPPEIVITRPTSGTAASTTLIYINGFSGFNAGLPTHANSAQFTVPSIRLQDGPDRSPSPSFGGWLISGINTVFAGVGTFTVSPTTELGTSTYRVQVTGTGLNGTVTKDVSVPVRVVAGPGGGGVADFALNPPNPNPLIIVRPTSGTLASSSSVLANNFTGFNPSVPNSNLVNCTSRLSRLSASLVESPIGAILPTPSPGAWSGSGGTGGLSSSCTSAMAFSIRSNTTPGMYIYRLSTVGTPPSGSALSKNTTQTVIVVPQGVSDVLSILPPRQTLVRPPAGSVSETMFDAVVSRVPGGYATTNYKPYTITSPQYQGITVNPNYIYPDFPSSSGIEGPSGINFQDGSTTNPSFLYETDLRGGVTWTHTQTGLGSISYRLIQNGSQATVQFDRDQGISSITSGELTLTARTGSGVSRSVQIPVTVSPIGQQLNPILVSITSSVPTTTRIIDIRSTVNPALQASFGLAILASSTTPTSTLPQCNDGVDNNDPEDTLADALDPGCHTDFNPNNIASYDPNDNDETNTPSYTLRILPPKDITATSPIPTSVSFPIRVVRQQGFNGSVQLLFQPSGSLPTGVTYSFSPATLSSSQASSTLTISAASNTILSLVPPRVDQQISFTIRGESSLTNEGSDSGSVTFAYSNDGCGCTYTSGVRFRDGKILLGWSCNDIDPTDKVELYRTYATYVSPPGITTFNNSNETGPISLTNGYDNDPGVTTPSNNTIKAVRYQLKCIQGNTTIPPTVNPNRDIIRKVFAPFGATILEQ